ncbi:MarR family winged helix-turn-helix transcriptional regulator [Actinomadura sp. 9N407]|uniref:MarR family winged helix-turn-helix transcriptional regulator n=1 Tax=Actinomadura sp. 9N407 TaxID=3375154 RepID=UPI0037AF6EA2
MSRRIWRSWCCGMRSRCCVVRSSGLGWSGPPPSMKAMAERLHCSAPNLTFMANQLADRGLVERAVDPADRRSRVLILTAKGRRVRDEIIRAAQENNPLGTLSTRELQQFTALLNRALRPGEHQKHLIRTSVQRVLR